MNENEILQNNKDFIILIIANVILLTRLHASCQLIECTSINRNPCMKVRMLVLIKWKWNKLYRAIYWKRQTFVLRLFITVKNAATQISVLYFSFIGYASIHKTWYCCQYKRDKDYENSLNQLTRYRPMLNMITPALILWNCYCGI